MNGAGVESMSAKWQEMFGVKEEVGEGVKVKKPRKKVVKMKEERRKMKPAVKKAKPAAKRSVKKKGAVKKKPAIKKVPVRMSKLLPTSNRKGAKQK